MLKEKKLVLNLEILNKSNFLNKWSDIFNSHKKKDDMADSFTCKECYKILYLRKN